MSDDVEENTRAEATFEHQSCFLTSKDIITQDGGRINIFFTLFSMNEGAIINFIK